MDAPLTLPGALDWAARCRTVTVSGRRFPVTDIALAAFFVLTTMVSATLPVEYGWSPVYAFNVLLHGGLAVAQLLRRVTARTSLAVTGALLGAYAVLVATSPVNLGLSPVIFAAPCAVFAAARWIPNRLWGVGALLAALVGSLGNPAALSRFTEPSPTWNATWNATAGIAAVVVTATSYALAAQLRSRAERQEAEIRVAVAQDRLRISQELHDLVGHGLTVVKVQAQTAKAIGTAEAAAQALDAVIAASGESLEDVRSLVARLRDEADGTPPAADPVTIHALISQTRDNGVSLTASVPSPESLRATTESWPEHVRLVFLRVVTEALTNITRHSDGSATLTVTVVDGECTVTTMNPCRTSDAQGSSPEVGAGRAFGHHGLTGIRERLADLGGTLDARTTGREFILDARFPVPPEPEEKP